MKHRGRKKNLNTVLSDETTPKEEKKDMEIEMKK